MVKDKPKMVKDKPKLTEQARCIFNIIERIYNGDITDGSIEKEDALKIINIYNKRFEIHSDEALTSFYNVKKKRYRNQETCDNYYKM